MKKIKKVLLIDDDNISKYINRSLLDELGIAEEILEIENGELALDFLKKCSIDKQEELPDLILLDLHMGSMTGLELLKELKKLGLTDLINSRIVVLTGSQLSIAIDSLKELGVKKIAPKVLSEEHILAIVYSDLSSSL